jgi:uncharacterized protein YjiS (DUF1127 family)
MVYADPLAGHFSRKSMRLGVAAWLERTLRSVAEGNPRLRYARMLQAMNDRQLRALGIARHEIAHHAFRDVYYR